MIDLGEKYWGFRIPSWTNISKARKEPEDSREHKWGDCEYNRKSKSTAAAVALPISAALLLSFFSFKGDYTPSSYVTKMMEPSPPIEELEPIKEIEPVEPTEYKLENVNFDPISIEHTITEEPFVGQEVSPTIVEGVANIKSPRILRGIYTSRGPGAREGALTRYGAPGGVEGVVMNALRWLKINQLDDGSWSETTTPPGKGEVKPAMTGLALLTYLAHAETPASPEFGYTVEKAIKWLIDNQKPSGKFGGSDGHDYSLPIAGYALSEAYSLTRNPNVKYAAEKAIRVIVKGQNPSGGFNYNAVPGGSARNDISYGGWCVQALKAAKIAKLDVGGLDESLKRAVNGIKLNFSGSYDYGGFGYTGPGKTPLTGVGALALQLLGQANSDEVSGSIKYLKDVNPEEWDQVDWKDAYWWYYDIQAAFHHGGDVWKKWNKEFATLIANNQIVLEGIYEDNKDIGYWSTQGNVHGHIQDTTFLTLALEVYYRYLPTFQELTPIDEIAKEDPNEIKIDIDI